MAIESTRDLCLSVADAIREKKGSSELINPQDFAKEIASIEGGGSGGGGSNVEYFDVRELDVSIKALLVSISILAQVDLGEAGIGVIPPTLGFNIFSSINSIAKVTKYAAVDLTLELNLSGATMTVKDFIDTQVLVSGFLDSIPRITKEQFYDLNA